MLLYTYQTKEAYRRLTESGRLAITEGERGFTLAERDGWQDCAAHAYEYMKKEMVRALGEPPEDVVYPIWAWYKWEGGRAPTAEHDKSYAGMIRITFRVDRRRVLLSDFDLFTVYCMGNMAIPLDGEESEAVYAMPPEVSRSELYKYYKKATWERIFRMDVRGDGYVFDGVKSRSVQATLWELRAEQIVEAVEIPG